MDKIDKVAQTRAKSLVYPSLITRLCYEAGVATRLIGEEKKPAKEIHPLKKRGGQGNKIRGGLMC